MSRYERDWRVSRAGNGYTVTTGGTEYRVLPSSALGWDIYAGPNLDPVSVADRSPGTDYPSADEAISALIGAPHTT